MRRLGCVVAGLGVLFWAHGSGVEAAAAGPDQGTLNAVAFDRLPDERVIAVRSLDDSEDNLALKAHIEAVLRSRGFGVTEGAARLVLTFQTSAVVGAWDDRSGALIEAQRYHDETIRKDLDSYMLNLFNSRKGSLLERPGPPTRVQPSQYRLDATLDDRSTGRRVWQGWMVAALQRGAPELLVRAMVPPLIDSVGTTVRSQAFELE